MHFFYNQNKKMNKNSRNYGNNLIFHKISSTVPNFKNIKQNQGKLFHKTFLSNSDIKSYKSDNFGFINMKQFTEFLTKEISKLKEIMKSCNENENLVNIKSQFVFFILIF